MYQLFNIDTIKMRKAKKSNIKSYNEAINLRDLFQKVSYIFLLQIFEVQWKEQLSCTDRHGWIILHVETLDFEELRYEIVCPA